ncbi:MAG: hypothetical protein NWE89_05835 [Candidatus Bathyarchaeota archaeon]|nr:hypothetical protein [Candidatus Bathyarchaeota archaeon]
MSAKNNKITWITCPDCGSKIGIVLSVGKADPTVIHEPAAKWPPEEQQPTPQQDQPQDFRSNLQAAGVDIALLEIEEDGALVSISPKKFLGDQWGPINDVLRGMGGNWIRDGRNSRWELRLEEA